MNNINEIKNSQLCFGCGTCNVVCNKDAITMQYDNIGRLMPILDEAKCVNCGLCSKICPSLDQKRIQLPDAEDHFVGHVINTYIGKATDERIFRNSQSGGMVTATLKYLFDTGKINAAIVCKVIDEIEYTPKAMLITQVSELYDSQRSSYVPVDMVSAIKGADQYKSIAVVGTGCNIQGFSALKDFGKNYGDKIKYTLGLICDRTLCKTATDVLYAGFFKDKKKRIVWRDKSSGYREAQLKIKTDDGMLKTLPRWKRFALKDPFTNPRCRICFDKLNTHADIVFGDPWGMSDVDWKNGMSLVLTRTSIGDAIIKDMLEMMFADLHSAPLSEVIKGQHIEKRKQDLSIALSLYKKQGWLMPSYADKFGFASGDTKLPKLIMRFVHDASLTKLEIIDKNIKMLHRESWRKTCLYRTAVRILKFIKRIVKQ